MMKSKILVILGPTATGKSALAVTLAKKFNGEIISADSRQVYRGLDLGSGKITSKEMKGISHHLLDVANPRNVFNVERFKQLAERKILEITERKKLPILCGGTGFYIQSVIDNISYPDVPPNLKLRASLRKKSSEEVFTLLKELDPRRASEMDPKNTVRLIRAIEIAKKLGSVPEVKKNSSFATLQIGIDLPDSVLRKNISKRLSQRIHKGMLEEVENLHKRGLSWKRMDELGLEYRCISRHLRGLISYEEMTRSIENESWQYVKRQRTWFRRDERIRWFSPKEKAKIMSKVKEFVKN